MNFTHDTGASCSAVNSVTINGDPQGNSIDLQGLNSSNFPNATPITVNGNGGGDSVAGSNQAETIDLTGTGAANTFNAATFTGRAIFDGAAGPDHLTGGTGDDRLTGGGGSDTAAGGNGMELSPAPPRPPRGHRDTDTDNRRGEQRRHDQDRARGADGHR